MPVDIFGGGTGIFINGREIHPQDQQAIYMITNVTYPGNYWLDAQGNLGVLGGPFIVNLIAMAYQNGGGGAVGGGGGSGLIGTAGDHGMVGIADGSASFLKRMPNGKMLSYP